MRALVTGATGFVGQQLLAVLDRPVVLSRDAERARRKLASFRLGGAFSWNLLSELPPAKAFENIDAIFHLAGEPVADGRWTKARKDRIRASREVGTRNLVDGLQRLQQRPRVLVSASAVGYYGSRGEELLEEGSTAGNDFLAHVCQTWESEAARASRLGMRVVTPRIGLVLGKGGALPKVLRPFKFGFGGRLGDGQQWMPWIHVDDLIGMLLHVVDHPEIHGPINAVAPAAVRNRDFTKALGRALRRPTFFPVPRLGLRVLFGEFADVLFASQKVRPAVALQTGYRFRFDRIEPALEHLLRSVNS